MPATRRSSFASAASSSLETPPRCAHGNPTRRGPRSASSWRRECRTPKTNRTTRTGSCATPSQPVPELTRDGGINLNERVSLREPTIAIASSVPDIAPIRTQHMAKPSGDHTPSGGFVLRGEGMTTRSSSRGKPPVASKRPRTLEQQFHELKRLRKKVAELQQMAAKAEAAKRNRPPN
jgi:hypothetical protein